LLASVYLKFGWFLYKAVLLGCPGSGQQTSKACDMMHAMHYCLEDIILTMIML
jgi:hypothetical protein